MRRRASSRREAIARVLAAVACETPPYQAPAGASHIPFDLVDLEREVGDVTELVPPKRRPNSRIQRRIEFGLHVADGVLAIAPEEMVAPYDKVAAAAVVPPH